MSNNELHNAGKPPHSHPIIPNSPETNSTKRVDEKRGRVAWPVEKLNKEAKTKLYIIMQALQLARHTHIAHSMAAHYKK